MTFSDFKNISEVQKKYHIKYKEAVFIMGQEIQPIHFLLYDSTACAICQSQTAGVSPKVREKISYALTAWFSPYPQNFTLPSFFTFIYKNTENHLLSDNPQNIF